MRHPNEKNLSFVYKKSGSSLTKQEIYLGALNETDGIVYGGVRKGDLVLLTLPTDTTGISLSKITAKSAAPKPKDDTKWKERWAKFQALNLVPKSNQNGLPPIPSTP